MTDNLTADSRSETDSAADAAAADADAAATIVMPLIARARAAMTVYGEQIAAAAASGSDQGQSRIDEAVTALAWSLYKLENATRLAKIAVAQTGLGNVESKIIKNQRKTFGTLRDLLRAKSTGVIEYLPARGLVKYAKPVGVIAAITPSTNPAATPVNKAMMALKGGNAIIIAPPPTGWDATNPAVENMRAALAQIGLPEDLVQILPQPVSRAASEHLMRLADLIVCTGSQKNVKAAYSSGKPALGVGLGNAPAIIDSSADLDDAATKIMASKTFDNATSCSSENALVIVDAVYKEALKALRRHGGYLASPQERGQIIERLWVNGLLNRAVIAQDFAALVKEFKLSADAKDRKFVMVEETGTGPDHPLSGEKLSLVLTIYRARDFGDAKARVKAILDYQGRGHSCGIHTREMANARALARDTDVVRVLVNQAHTFGNGGGFDNGLDFTLTMGCGTWQGNALGENLSWKHFVNITHLVSTIPPDQPSEEELFGAHWRKYGK